MDAPGDATQTQPQPAEFDDSLPPGNHALEVAARAGFGPLSPRAQEVWHGQAIPCVSCGQLVHRDDPACEQCGQDLSEEMIRKMKQHAGPWFVLEHVRPFPGVSLERIVRQIRRGLITETSIVRGPSNDFQWRFAVETPGLCRYFGKCWCCHATVTLSDTYCPHCLHYLSFEKPRPVHQSTETEPRQDHAAVTSGAGAGWKSAPQPVPVATTRPATVSTAPKTPPGTAPHPVSVPQHASAAPRAPESSDLARLSAAVRQARVLRTDSEWDQPPRVGGVNVSWIAALLIIGAVVALLVISRARSDRSSPPTSPELPAMQAPAGQMVPAAPAGSGAQPSVSPSGTAPSNPEPNRPAEAPQDPSKSSVQPASPGNP